MEILDKGLGRFYIPDERDAAFPMSAVIGEAKELPSHKYWNDNQWWGDQGRLPHCVGFAWAHWLEDGPITQLGPKAQAVAPDVIYHEAQKVDQWAGEDYDGTSVRAGAKVLKTKGFIESYSWAWDADTVAEAILSTGPVVVGTAWHRDMFFPNAEGIITPTGAILGGHAYLINGYSSRRGLFRLKNSWGRDWGREGRAYISHADLNTLIKNYGEACLAAEIKV